MRLELGHDEVCDLVVDRRPDPRGRMKTKPIAVHRVRAAGA
jgi:hypothetical protein